MANRLDLEFGAKGSLRNLRAELQGVQKAIQGVNAAMVTAPPGQRRGLMDTFQRDLDKFEKSYKRTITSIDSIKGRTLEGPVTQLTHSLSRGELKLSQFGDAFRNFGGLVNRQARMLRSAFVTTGIDEFGNRVGRLMVPKTVTGSWFKFTTALRTFSTVGALASKEMIKLGKNMQWAGRQVLVGFGIPLAFLSARSLATFLKLNEEFTRLAKVYTTQSGNIKKELRGVKSAIEDVAEASVKEFGVSKQQAIETAANFASMGNTIESAGGQLETLTRQTLRVATLGEMSHEGATELVRTLQQVWRMDNEGLTQTLNTLNSVENTTALTMDMMKDAIPVVAGTVKELGLSAEFTAAMLAGMVEKGEDATEAANALKFSLVRMTVGTEPLQKWSDATGTSLEKIREESNGTAELLTNITKVLRDLPNPEKRLEAVAALVQPRRAGQAIKLFDSLSEAMDGVDNGFARAAESIGKFDKNAESAESELEAIRESAAGTARILKERMQVVLQDIGEVIAETFLPFASKLVELMERFSELPKSTKKAILGFVSLGAVMGGLTMFLGLAFNLMGQFGNVLFKVLPKFKNWSFYQHAAHLATSKLNTSIRTEISLLDQLTKSMGAASAANIFDDTLRQTAAAEAFAPTTRAFSTPGMSARDKKRALSASMAKLDQKRLEIDGVTATRGKRGNIRFFEGSKRLKDADGINRFGGHFQDVDFDHYGGGGKRKRFARTRARVGGLARRAPGAARIGRGAQMMRMSGAVAGLAGRGVMGGAAKGLTTLTGKMGKFGTILQAIPKLLGKVFAKLGGFKGIVGKLGIAGLIAGIAAAVMDMQKFIAGFKEAFDIPALKKVWDMIKSIGKIFSSLKDNGGETADAVARVSKGFGQIVGWVANELVRALEVVVNIVRFIASGLTDFIGGLIRFFDILFNGDGPLWQRLWKATLALFEGIGKGLLKLLMGAVLPLFRWIVENLATILDKLPGKFGEGMAKNLRGFANNLERTMDKALNIGSVIDFGDIGARAKEQIEASAEVSKDATDIIVKMWRQAGHTMLSENTKITEEAIKNSKKLSDEQKKFMLLWIKLQELRSQLSAKYAERERLQARANADAITGILKWNIQKNAQELESILGQIEGVTNDVAFAMNNAEESASLFGSSMGDVTEGTSEASDALSEYVSALRGAATDAVNDLVSAVKDAFNTQRDEALKAIDDQIEALKKQDSEEEKLDKKREHRAKLEEMRRKRLLNVITTNIEIEVALAEGQLGQAAILQERLKASEEQYYFDRMNALEDSDEKEKKKKKSQEEKDLEDQKKAKEKQLDEEEKALQKQLEALMRHVPRSEKEFKEWKNKLLALTSEYGIDLSEIVAEIPGNMMTTWGDVMFDALATIKEDKRWEHFGESVGEKTALGIIQGIENEVRRELGLPVESSGGGSGGGGGTSGGSRYEYGAHGYNYNNTVDLDDQRRHRRGGVQEFHIGGKVRGGSKADIPAILQEGEFVIKRDTVKRFGQNFFERVNKGELPMPGVFHEGGSIGGNSSAFAKVVNVPSIHELMHGLVDKFRNELPASRAGGSDGAVFNGQVNGGWPPAVRGRLSANTKAARDFLRNNWNLPHGIGSGLDRKDKSSDHGWGKALDAMVSKLGTYPNERQRQKGWDIANFFASNPNAFGTKYVIWDKMIYNPSRGDKAWRPYTRYGSNPGPTLGHYDHVHASFLHEGGLVPKLRKGAFIKKDMLANIHKGETVLTSPLTRELQEGIKKMNAGNGGGGDVHVHVHVQELYGDRQFVDLLANKVTGTVSKEIKMQNSRKGRGLNL